MAKTSLHSTKHKYSSGFTLIELSIVLVIIGLIVGGVLVGQDLIKAAETRAQIGQIEKFNTAVNTFRLKYDYLPGDIPDPYATRFGFATRGVDGGKGDGDGLIRGFCCGGYVAGYVECGEPLMFWVDLSKAGLIDGGFNSATPSTCPGSDATGGDIALYYPKAKIGNGVYIYTLNVHGNQNMGDGGYNPNPLFYSNNFFSLSKITNAAFSSNSGQNESNPGISVIQAYSIDKKVDDGSPVTGYVQTVSYLQGDDAVFFSNGDLQLVFSGSNLPGSNSPISPASNTCYDNKNSAFNPVTYSLSNGNSPNCSLSFQFQ